MNSTDIEIKKDTWYTLEEAFPPDNSDDVLIDIGKNDCWLLPSS